MNLAVIPEETEEELEEEAQDVHWRENWIFKGLPDAYSQDSRKKLNGEQLMMVPRPEDYLAPRIGNRYRIFFQSKM